VPPEHRPAVIARIAAHLRPDGFLVVGSRTGREYTPEDLDSALPDAGLVLEHRFSTFDLRPWQPGADFCVSITRRPR